jgi:hypothetical protein
LPQQFFDLPADGGQSLLAPAFAGQPRSQTRHPDEREAVERGRYVRLAVGQPARSLFWRGASSVSCGSESVQHSRAPHHRDLHGPHGCQLLTGVHQRALGLRTPLDLLISFRPGRPWDFGPPKHLDQVLERCLNLPLQRLDGGARRPRHKQLGGPADVGPDVVERGRQGDRGSVLLQQGQCFVGRLHKRLLPLGQPDDAEPQHPRWCRNLRQLVGGLGLQPDVALLFERGGEYLTHLAPQPGTALRRQPGDAPSHGRQGRSQALLGSRLSFSGGPGRAGLESTFGLRHVARCAGQIIRGRPPVQLAQQLLSIRADCALLRRSVVVGRLAAQLRRAGGSERLPGQQPLQRALNCAEAGQLRGALFGAESFGQPFEVLEQLGLERCSLSIPLLLQKRRGTLHPGHNETLPTQPQGLPQLLGPLRPLLLQKPRHLKQPMLHFRRPLAHSRLVARSGPRIQGLGGGGPIQRQHDSKHEQWDDRPLHSVAYE